MRVKIMRVQWIEVPDIDGWGSDTDREDFEDSFTSTVNDEQGTQCETSDANYEFIPRELEKLEYNWEKEEGEGVKT